MSDPVKTWKTRVSKDTNALDDNESEMPATDYASSTSTTSGGPDFQYLLTMAIMSLSKEKKDELLRQRDEKVCLSCVVLYYSRISIDVYFQQGC